MSVASRIGVMVVRLWASTWRIRCQSPLPNHPCVVAFWHGIMLPVWYVFRRRTSIPPPTAIVSKSKDGSYLAALLEAWGYSVVRGSSSHGGSEALEELVKGAKQGVVLVTPDGPRGPAGVCKPGAVVAAHRAGVPVYAVVVHIQWCTRFRRSWDAFAVPLPFSRIDVHVSEPLIVPKDSSREQITTMVEQLQSLLGPAVRGSREGS